MSELDQVTLNAGDKSVVLPVLKPTLGNDCIDVSKLTRETGLFTYDSGFTATASCKSELAVMIDKFSDAIQDFAAIEPDVMNNDLRRLADALRAHLAYEETHVCPLLARHSRWSFSHPGD